MKNILFLCFAFLALSACSEVQLASHLIKTGVGHSDSQGYFKIGNPYKINGTTYRPQETYNFTETGIASWYGPKFHGKRTANGEIFDQNELTAAHRTLQLPAIVRVTNLENGRALIVRVNDRGPFARGRIIDLSKKAADLLGFKNKGTARVKIQILSDESRQVAQIARRGKSTKGMEIAYNEGEKKPAPPQTRTAISTLESKDLNINPPLAVPPTAVKRESLNAPAQFKSHIKNGNALPDPIVEEGPVTPTKMFVQVGSFSSRDSAQALALDLKKYETAHVFPTQIGDKQFFRVRLGPVPTVKRADSLLSQLASNGQTQAIIVVE